MDVNGISSGNGQKLAHLIKLEKIEEAKTYLEEIISITKEENIIISSENFYREPENSYKVIPNAKIIVYFREQLSQIQSSYNQSVKRHFQIHPFSRAISAVLRSNDPFYSNELIKKWLELYGKENIIFRVYEEDRFIKNNIFLDFMSSIGIEDIDIFKIPKSFVNVSYTRDALEYKLLFNRIKDDTLVDKSFYKKIDEALQKYSQEEKNKKEYIDYPLYTKEDIKVVNDFYKNSNYWLSKTFLDNKPLFLEVKELANINYKEITQFNILKITRFILDNYPELNLSIGKIVLNSLNSKDKNIQKNAFKLVSTLTMPRIQNAILNKK